MNNVNDLNCIYITKCRAGFVTAAITIVGRNINFPCGRKSEYPEKTRALTILYSNDDWVRVHNNMSFTRDQTQNLRGERRVV